MTDTDTAAGQTETAAATPANEPKQNAAQDAVDKWFVDHFHGSIVSRDTQVYNHVHAAYLDLKKRFA